MGKKLFFGFLWAFFGLSKVFSQACVSEKITVRVVQIDWAGAEPAFDPRVIPTVDIGGNSATGLCYILDNYAKPLDLTSEMVVNSQTITCGAALPTVNVSFLAHEDNSIFSNCTVNPISGEVEQTSSVVAVDISGIRTNPEHRVTQVVTAGSGSNLWTITFDVIHEQVSAFCSRNTYSNASAGFSTAALASADNGVSGKSYYNLTTGTLTQMATVRTDLDGNLGVFNTILVNATAANLPTCSGNTRATRTNTEALYLKDVSTGGCVGSAIPKTRDGVNSSTFNPEWQGLQPNTDYVLFFNTTLDGLCTAYTSSSVSYYGFPTVYSGGAFTYSFNCNGSTIQGNFVANGANNQTGILTIPIQVLNSGSVSISVSGTGFTGSLSTTLTATQTSVSVPILFDGQNTEGTRALTINSPQATGTCGINAVVQAACKADAGQIGR